MYKDLLTEFMTAEKNAVDELIRQTGKQYDKVIDALLECRGKVVFFGIGKSGHIGAKLAATFASTGTPAMFVHAAEARRVSVPASRPQSY